MNYKPIASLDRTILFSSLQNTCLPTCPSGTGWTFPFVVHPGQWPLIHIGVVEEIRPQRSTAVKFLTPEWKLRHAPHIISMNTDDVLHIVGMYLLQQALDRNNKPFASLDRTILLSSQQNTCLPVYASDTGWTFPFVVHPGQWPPHPYPSS